MAVPPFNGEVMAVIRNPVFGVEDRSYQHPCLKFTVHTGQGSAGQVLFEKDYIVLLRDGGITDIRELEGRTCWVKMGDGLIKFVALTKL